MIRLIAIYVMQTIIKAETKRINGVVFNCAVKVKDNDYYLLDCNSLNGEQLEPLFIGEKLFNKIDALAGKVIDIVYKQCIAGKTQYVDEDDIEETYHYHSVDHKQVVDVVKTNDINLLIACTKNGIKEMYNDLKELQK